MLEIDANLVQVWEVTSRNLEIVVRKDRCKGCELCVDICPKKILTLSNEISPRGYRPVTVTDAESCVGCDRCEWTCPDFAIYIIHKENRQKRNG